MMKKKEDEALTMEKYAKEFKDNFTLAKAAINTACHDAHAGKEFVLNDVFKSLIKDSKEKK